LHDHRSQSPVKKSRALSTPAEADENDNDEEEFVDALEHEVPTPSPRPSPPHETKIRQLSQGSDDISWRDGQIAPRDSADTAPAPVAPDNAATPDAQAHIGTPSPTTSATIPELQNQPDISAPGDVAVKAPIDETAATASVEHAAVPLPAAVPTTTEEVQVPATTPAVPVSQSEAQCTHKIDNQTSSALLAEARVDSNPRETKCPTPPLSEADCATKRPREDEDGDLDPNPREAKRASPPPEIEKEKEKKERPARKKNGTDAHAQSTPASPRSNPASAFVGCLYLDLFQVLCMLIRTQGGGGFLAYASVSSPFAAVKGHSLFGSSSTLTKSSTIVTTTTTTTPATVSNAAPTLTTTATLPNSPPKTAPNSPVQRTASPTPAKRSGFEAFASAASPFSSAAARARSPVRRSGSPGPGGGARSNPFAVYAAGGAQGLFGASGAPAAKRARGDSESIAPGEGGESSSWREDSAGAERTFGERLRAGSGSGGDEEDEADGGPGIWGEQVTGGKWTEQEGEYNFVVCMPESAT
jgi:Ran-binding protein 3